MQRTIDIEVSLEGLRVQNKPLFCEGDKNTHFLKINFMNDLDLAGYTLQIYYLPPYPCVIPFVDLFSEVTNNPFIVPIPNKILERNGEIKVEFSLSKENNLITINKTFNFEVVRTINGTSLTAYPEGTLKETIAQQIEKIKKLLAESQNKIDEYNNNTVEKTNKFDENAQTKTNEFNDNFEEKLKTYNDNSEEKLSTYNKNDILKTTEFNNNADKKLEDFNTKADEKATEAANTAALEANKLVVAQQNKSIKEVQTATTENKNNAISEIERKTLEQVEVLKTQGTTSRGEVEQTGTTAIDNINTTKTEVINSIDISKNSAIQALNDEKVKQVKAVTDQGVLTKQEVAEEGNKVVRVNKTELDTYVNTASKPHIDNYVTQKEGEIKGATFTPTVDEEGNISWVNDKNLENPTTKNIKGPQGDPGNFVFKVKNRHLMYYAVSNNSSPEFKLNKKHLIIKIK